MADDCVVVGGGLTEPVAAHAPAGHSLRVTVSERRRFGAMASGRTLGGVRQSGRDSAELRLARAAVARWAGLAAELGAETGHRRGGNLRLARDDEEGRQEIDGRLRVTTGIGDWPHAAERATEDTLMPPAGELARLIERAGAVLPAPRAVPVARVWGGFVDLTPDGLPVLDRPCEGLVVAAGFSGHGWCLGPVSGTIIADLVLGRRPGFDLTPFRLARFSPGAAGTVALSLHG